MDAHAANAISPDALHSLRAGPGAPLLIDVRREAAFRAAPDMAAGALRRDPATVATWAGELPPGVPIAVYCVHGHEVSQQAAQALRDSGRDARYVAGGLGALRAAGAPLLRKPAGAATRWVTRERPKVDRIACPWLVRRFIDRDAEFLYVPAAAVATEAAARDATPYDVADAVFGHDGPRCSFDAFVQTYRLGDPALLQLAAIVRGADTGHPSLTPQSAGLLMLSQGLSRLIGDDHAQLAQGLLLYDALYLGCRDGGTDHHAWQLPLSH